MSGKPFLLALILIPCTLIFASFLPGSAAYIFPMKADPALSGTFGELRSDHFHSGIDVKTYGKTGIPLYAVQEGYVYRIKVSPYGFGNAIYLRHPDGGFSVYGHMSRFSKALEAYAYKRQYASKQYNQEIYLDRNEIPVKQGELIGYSGNSGSSLGPHLHFEIRDAEENIMNPLEHYKYLIADTKAPILQEIAFEPLDSESRVKGIFKKYRIVPEGENGQYRVGQTIPISGRVGIEYRAYDLLNAAGNHCGINHAQLYLDDQLIYDYDLRKFSFDEKRYINLHIDYALYMDRKQRFQKAYIDSGNRFSGYQYAREKGVISLHDNALHGFRLELTDVHGNKTTVRGNLRNVDTPMAFAKTPTFYTTPKVSYEIRRNVLVLTAERAHRSYLEGLTYYNLYDEEKTLFPSYVNNNQLVFLLPLERYNYPTLIKDKVGKFHLSLNLKEEVLPDRNNLVEMDELQLFFPFESVFTRTPLEVKKRPGNSKMYSDIFRVGDYHIPMFKSYLVSFKPDPSVPLTHLVVAYKDNGDWEFAGNTLGEDGNVYCATREFGEFCLMADSIPPVVTPINFINGGTVASNQSRIVIKIKDEFTGIDHEQIYCTLNGEWKMFEYDYKRNTIVHDLTKQPRPAKGTYELVVRVQDKADNAIIKKYTLRF